MLEIPAKVIFAHLSGQLFKIIAVIIDVPPVGFNSPGA